jgi:dTDP-4-amino-4,6-dideoxygalactose transaminase
VVHTGAKPVLIDCGKDGYEMDYDALERAITKRTKAIIPVDLAGLPCDYKRIFEIVERKKKLFKPNGKIQQTLGRIAVMADTAHSLGAERNGVKTGALADFSSFSFHAVKNLTTAEGGALTWRSFGEELDEEIYKQIQLLSLHGQSKDALAKTKLGAWEYDIVGTWYKCNMTDIAAAMGLTQLERYPKMLARRREIIQKYDEAFRKLGVETVEHYTDEYSSSGHLYLTRVPNISYAERQEIIEKMAEKEIACNVHYKPLPMHTAYRNLGYDIKNFPNAYKRFVNEITLPLHTCLTDEQVDFVIENYCNIVREYL